METEKEFIERTKKYILWIHEKVVSINNDPVELRQGSSLDFLIYDALKRTKNRFSFILLLMKNIAEQHPFIEGNKRTAYTFCKTSLLFGEGKILCLNQEIAGKFMKDLAKKSEQGKPKNLKSIEIWVSINCVKIPNYNKNHFDLIELRQILKNMQKDRAQCIKKYLKEYPFDL